MDINYLRNLLFEYFGLIFFYLPLGIIGIWRWGVWLIRKSIAFFYSQPKGNFQATLSIITPVYNEDPELFKRALSSWKDSSPDEIIAVIDYSDKKNIEIFERFSEGFGGARMIVTEKPGKRPALADGTRASRGEIIALVDSDTVWSPRIKHKLLGPFEDPKVGGLVTRQDVFETDTLARKLFKILLDDRYLLEYPFLGTVSDALLCLSGRTAVYRREAIIDRLDELENETFWGKKMISGDDKTLTRLVQKNGWKTRYLRDVKVYTSGTSDVSGFMKQKLRWTRNGLRSDSRVLFSNWVWKRHKMLALHMLDKFISPLTLLVAPAYFVVSLYFGNWFFAGIILTWWLVSRTVKIYPHLKEKPGDIFILPVYIVMTFVMAVVKLYALITIDEQGWITRWDSARLKSAGFFRKAIAYGATGALVSLLFFLVFNYKNEAMILAEEKKQLAQQRSILTTDKPRMSESEIEMRRADLREQHQDDPHGYYVVKTGDTAASLRKRYNLSSAGRILNVGNKSPIRNTAPLIVGQQIAIPASDLHNPVSKNVLTADPLAKPPRVTYDAPSNTIFVRQGGSVATLTKINQALPLANRNLLSQTTPGEWMLRANLYIGQDVTLVIDGDEVKYLKLKSDSNGFVWVRSQSGSILLNNTKVSSWDEKSGAPDIEYESGRAYITAKSSGRMDIINSDLGYLGYGGLPNRGGPFGGSYGVSWKNENRGFRDGLLTGVVTGSKFHHNYFGFYTFGVTGMLVRGNEAFENIQYGFDPHDDSNNMMIVGNRAYRNGNHGIILSRRCFDNVIIGNVSHDNRLHGIMLDRESNNNLVQDNTVYGNVDGIAIYDSDNNIVLDNEIRNNNRGVRINAGSAGNYFEKNNIFGNSRGIYIYDQSENNIMVRNQVRNNDIGITIKNASRNSLFDNFKMFDNGRDGRVTGDSYENNIQ